MIEVKNLHKSFDGKEVLHDISAQFHQGKVNQIIGQSGSGKTVLMKSIIGLYPVDRGKVLYDNRNLPDMSKRDISALRREVGMLFQGAALFDSQTVINNVLFPLEMFATQMSKTAQRARAVFCLERVNLPQTAFDLYPAEISGGMQKRVAIARAIALNPKYLFCDEPNSGLDPITALVIDRLIEDITKEFEITTIVNTHDMNSIMEIGAHIIFIEKGHKAWEGSKENIFTSDNEALNNFVFASKFFKKVKQSVNTTEEL
ncbi:MAG: ATP-binding cassette domain-containing protein [Prevotellaceae bacterium]|jgi:phospholipid/cholesterol/gamma-HCH transport system ATP-binding protein|nr:ATP-binding cassette domain-containing protein [Prevotellaceae bacterium]